MEKLLNVENDWDGKVDSPEIMGPCCLILEQEVASAIKGLNIGKAAGLTGVVSEMMKSNMHHIHISIVSMHLATRGNNKILRTPPPDISSSEEILSRLTRRTLSQLRTNKSPFLKSYLHKVDAKSYPSPLCPLCNSQIHNTHNLFNFTHIRTTLSPLE